MSNEMHAFLPGHELPTRTAWQEALNRLEVPLELGPGPEAMVLRGFCPMTLKGEHLGVEIYIDDLSRLLKIYPEIPETITEVSNVITFRWEGSLKQVAFAFAASSALVGAFGAILFFPEQESMCNDAPEVITSMNLCYDLSNGVGL